VRKFIAYACPTSVGFGVGRVDMMATAPATKLFRLAEHTDPEPPPQRILRAVSGGRNGSAQEGGSEANSGGFRGGELDRIGQYFEGVNRTIRTV